LVDDVAVASIDPARLLVFDLQDEIDLTQASVASTARFDIFIRLACMDPRLVQAHTH